MDIGMEFIATLLVIVAFLQAIVNAFLVHVNRNLGYENEVLYEELDKIQNKNGL